MSLKTSASIIGLMLAFAVGSANAEEQSVTNDESSQTPIVTLGNIAAEPMAAAELAKIQGEGHQFGHVISSFGASLGTPNSGGMNWSGTAVVTLMGIGH